MSTLDASSAKLQDMLARLDDGSEPVIVQLVSTLIAANDAVLVGAALVREQRAEIELLRQPVSSEATRLVALLVDALQHHRRDMHRSSSRPCSTCAQSAKALRAAGVVPWTEGMPR